MLPKSYVSSVLDLIISCLAHSSNLKTEVARSFETSVNCRIRQHGVPDDSALQSCYKFVSKLLCYGEVDWIEVAETGSSLLWQYGSSLGSVRTLFDESVKLSSLRSKSAGQSLTREAYTK
jgi:hypothetical protein